MRNNLTILITVIFLFSQCNSNSQTNENAKQFKEQGNSYAAKGDYAEAINQYKKAIQIDSNFADCFFKLQPLFEEILANLIGLLVCLSIIYLSIRLHTIPRLSCVQKVKLTRLILQF